MNVPNKTEIPLLTQNEKIVDIKLTLGELLFKLSTIHNKSKGIM